MVATERSGRVTERVGASGQESAVGRAATLQAVTRVKPEQASKVKSWMPTRPLTGGSLRMGTDGSQPAGRSDTGRLRAGRLRRDRPANRHPVPCARDHDDGTAGGEMSGPREVTYPWEF